MKGILLVPVSVGELVDKITILEIKRTRISDESKLSNVRRELALLSNALVENGIDEGSISSLTDELRQTNSVLWEVEDRLRELEGMGQFDGEFIELARKVYFTNDHRSRLKRQINEITGSGVVEEKSYSEYSSTQPTK